MSIFDNQQICQKLTDVYVNEYIIPVQYSDHLYESQNMAQDLFELCGQAVWDGEIERLVLEPFRACKVVIFRTIHDIYDKI